VLFACARPPVQMPQAVTPAPPAAAAAPASSAAPGAGAGQEPAAVARVTDLASVAGIVQDSGGEAVEGALVAIVPERGDRAAAVVRTGAGGRFEASVPAGRYALTATAPRLTAAYQPVSEVKSGSPTQFLLRLGGEGFDLRGRLEVTGTPPAGARVVASRLSDFQGDGFEAEGYMTRPLRVKGGADTSVTLAAVEPQPAPDEVVSWMRNQALPLVTTEAEQGFADMEPLKELIGSARIVAVGEATHGTREFFQLKHRLLEFLVSEMGFTVFGIEANWPESLAVDDYVVNGVGDPARALAGLYFWTWDTEEVLDMIRWMRRYNADPRHEKKVHFQGFDMQFPRVAAGVVAAYLARVDPPYAHEVEGLLAPLGDKGREPEKDPKKKAAFQAGLAALLARCDEKKAEYSALSSAAEWTLVRQHANVLVQALSEETAVGSDPSALRDRAMAANVGWILDQQPPGTRMMLWAHNGHVNLANDGDFGQPMGKHLRQRFGDDYLALGFVCDQGSFQPIDWTAAERQAKVLAEFTLGPSPPAGVGAAFARTGLPLFVLDLRRLPPGPVASWFSSLHPMRETGAVFTSEAGMTPPTTLTDRFDAVIFVGKTTRARPTPTGRRDPK